MPKYNQNPDRELEFERMLRAHRIGGWQRELRFHPTRKWRFDFSWPNREILIGSVYTTFRLAVEIDGGLFQGGRHVHATGLRRDYEKMQAALDLGWIVFRIFPEMIQKQATIDTIRRFVGDGGEMPAVQPDLELPEQPAF